MVGTFMGGFIWGGNIGWIGLSDITLGKFVSVDAATEPVDCDLNHDGAVNGLDIRFFVDVVPLSATPDWRDVCSGDVEPPVNQMIDLDHVSNFVDCMPG